MSKPKVVGITGVGPVSPIGNGEAFWQSLCAGKSGTRALTRVSSEALLSKVVAEVLDPAFDPIQHANPVARATLLALKAAGLALADAKLEIPKNRIGIVVGTSLGNVDVAESVLKRVQDGKILSPGAAFNTFAHNAACEIARQFDLRGPIQTLSSGCNSGLDAIGLAFDWIRLGRADAVLVGGVENEINELFLQAMGACRALAVRHNANPQGASRPFDSERDGNVPGEGAGFLVLESLESASSRGSTPRAVMSAYRNHAVGTRQYNPFQPDLQPEHMISLMEATLEDAGISADELSVISANGSSSVLYDAMEAQAIQSLEKHRSKNKQKNIPVYSIKGAIGQSGACASSLQALAAVMTVQNNLIPPTINVDQLAANCPIDLVIGKPREMSVQHILCNAIGFGGFYYSSAIFSKPSV